MKENILSMNYKGLSEEELKQLPVDELARALHEAIKEVVLLLFGIKK